jgi:hypothetical protein
MSSSRNKRKRPETDSGGTPPVSRRRSRADVRAAAAPDATTADEDKKNEEDAITTEPKIEDGVDQVASDEPPQLAKDAGNSSEVLDSNMPNSSQDSSSENAAPITPNKLNGGEPAASSAVPANSSSSEPGSTSTEQEKNKTSEPQTPAAAPVEGKEEASIPVDDAGASDGDTRESRIRALISHRKLLLQRIKSCRYAVESRLDGDYNGKTIQTGESSTGSKPGKPPGDNAAVGAKKELTDEEELAAFRELTRLATQAAKKHRSEVDGTAEKRTTVSLRRGASVGKRMTQALSALAPGASVAAAVEAPTTQTLPVTTSKPIAPLPKAQPLTLVASKTLAPVPGARLLPTLSQPPIVASKSVKNTAQLSSNLKQPAPGTFAAQRSRAPNSKGMKFSSSGSRMSSSVRPDSATMPLHMGATSAALPPNRLAGVPKVKFPEAITLRERRNAIRSKLTALLERQKQKYSPAADATSQGESAATASGGATNTSQKTKLKTPEWMTQGQPNLPRRRRTHWDHLLEEMSWMATDFIEERKWKVSTARTLGSAITTPRLAVVSPPTGKKTEATATMSKESTGSSEVPEKTLKESASAVKVSSAKTESRESERYAQPTLGDSKSTRRVAKLMSSMISELCSASLESGSLSRTDDSHAEALIRFLEVRGKTEKASSCSRDSQESDEHTAQQLDVKGQSHEEDTTHEAVANREDMLVEETSFESISEYIEALEEVPEGRIKSTKNEKPKVFDSEGFNAYAGQKDAIQFVEELWDRPSSPGAILAGPASSGKTIATCALLWKQRSHGPQVIVCPPASVVSIFEFAAFDRRRVSFLDSL